MSSPARRMRRAQARQIAKQIAKQPAPAPPPPPAQPPAGHVEQRLEAMGVQTQQSLLWTPPRTR